MVLGEREIYFIKRRRLNITLDEIAAYLNVHKSSISRYENSKMNFTYENEKLYKSYIDSKQN